MNEPTDLGRLRTRNPEAPRGYSWPGNVRQPRNVVRRALVLARGTVLTPEDLPREIVCEVDERGAQGTAAFFELRAESQDRLEKDYLARIFRECVGDVTEAARRAQVPRGTLYRLMKKHDLGAGVYRSPVGKHAAD